MNLQNIETFEAETGSDGVLWVKQSVRLNIDYKCNITLFKYTRVYLAINIDTLWKYNRGYRDVNKYAVLKLIISRKMLLKH